MSGKEMAGEPSKDLAPDTVVHRIGGAEVANLRLKSTEQKLAPSGFSVLMGGTPKQAADQMRRAYPNALRLHEAAKTVASATVAAIRKAGFEVQVTSSRHFPNHARVVHSEGVAGFSDVNLGELAKAF